MRLVCRFQLRINRNLIRSRKSNSLFASLICSIRPFMFVPAIVSLNNKISSTLLTSYRNFNRIIECRHYELLPPWKGWKQHCTSRDLLVKQLNTFKLLFNFDSWTLQRFSGLRQSSPNLGLQTVLPSLQCSTNDELQMMLTIVVSRRQLSGKLINHATTGRF